MKILFLDQVLGVDSKSEISFSLAYFLQKLFENKENTKILNFGQFFLKKYHQKSLKILFLDQVLDTDSKSEISFSLAIFLQKLFENEENTKI